MQNYPEVEVLLATYNGSEHIAEFLESLANQEGVSIHLKVSDDNSSDQTIKIIESFRPRFKSVLIKKGPQLGPMKNFFSLIQSASLDYIALADQDDIWFSNHLYNSYNRVSTKSPKITFSKVLEFEAGSKEKSRVWPRHLHAKAIENLIFENQVRGCTIVFNKSFLHLYKQYESKNAIMHDWWIALLGISTNSLVEGTACEVKYRIHNRNFVGSTPSLKVRFFRFIKIIRDGSYPPLGQLQDLQKGFNQIFTPEMNETIEKWLAPLTFQKMLRQVCTRSRLRMNPFEDLLLRVSFIWLTVRNGLK